MSYDRFGLSPAVLRRAFPFFYALHRLYFRVNSRGHEHLPERGSAIIASNHGGLLPFDGAMLIVDILLNSDPPRLARSIVDRFAGDLPWVGVFYARIGQVIGTRENFADLLADDQLVLVFPEGVAGIRKTIAQRNRLQTFHVGFVEEALRSGTPIVPTAVVGADDQAPILYDFSALAKRLGLPALPITPTFPLLGPLGLLPYPVRYRIVYGEPLDFHERFGPEDADDARLVRYLARQVRHRVQQLVDREA
jgi:1-acyl-sn-glycerol-3-phosphate acyltransferase